MTDITEGEIIYRYSQTGHQKDN